MSITTPDRFGAPSAAALTKQLTGARRDVRGRIVEWILLTTLGLSLMILVALIVNLVDRAWPILDGRLGDFLSSGLDASNAAEAGVWQAIRGTLTLAIIVAVIAFPLGIACAVYLEEYAGRSRVARLIRINVRNLAGVPSIVYGILGLTIFVKFAGGLTGGRTVIAGGLTLATLVLPVVIITASEALRAVPQSIREGALGVGATKWETVRSHVLPSAAPGILTGTVLALSRAAGEAAPLLLVGGITGLLRTGNLSLWEQITEGGFTSMPVAIFSYARQTGTDFQAVTGAASLILLILVIVINGLAIWLRNRFERRW
ncbi:MAG: phosphate transporter permease PstA [Actinomycetota bacterium]|jgi:phosphate transport system permease protein